MLAVVPRFLQLQLILRVRWTDLVQFLRATWKFCMHIALIIFCTSHTRNDVTRTIHPMMMIVLNWWGKMGGTSKSQHRNSERETDRCPPQHSRWHLPAFLRCWSNMVVNIEDDQWIFVFKRSTRTNNDIHNRELRREFAPTFAVANYWQYQKGPKGFQDLSRTTWRGQIYHSTMGPILYLLIKG